MNIMDREPCFDPSHMRNNKICLVCKRPTPFFPEWVGKMKSLRTQLEKAKVEICHLSDRDEWMEKCRLEFNKRIDLERKAVTFEAKLNLAVAWIRKHREPDCETVFAFEAGIEEGKRKTAGAGKSDT